MDSSKPHIVVFPFMSQGHTIPLLDLSKALARRALKVTIITTPWNASSIIKPYLENHHHQTRIITIPFPKNVQGLPSGIENMSRTSSPSHVMAFFNATKLLKEPFESAMIRAMNDDSPPTCVVSDSFLGWTNSVCRDLHVPRLVFNGMGVFAAAVRKSLYIDHETYHHALSLHGGDKVDVEGIDLSFELTRRDLPMSLMAMDSEMSRFFLEGERSDLGSWGVIANSFVEIEKGCVSFLERLYGNGARALCVGPLFMYEQMERGSEVGPDGPSPCAEWAQWLNHIGEEREEGSVIYVSFGSQANLCDDQLDELAHGLEQSGEDYIWAVGSKSWVDPRDGISGGARGLVVREWVDQKWILAHPAIGGFLTHCGWNSVLESLTCGVPVLAWPMHAEQHLNARYLVEELEVGIGLESGWARDGRVVGRDEICEGVRELMKGVRGRKARENAIELGKIAKRAVQVGGSSYDCLDEIVEMIHEEKARVDSIGEVARSYVKRVSN